MQLPNNTNTTVAIPWEFDEEEISQIQTVLTSPLIRAYLQSLKYLALEGKLSDPAKSTEQDVKAANDFMCGQEYVITALLAPQIYVPTQPKGV